MKHIARMSWAIALITLLHIPAGHAQTLGDSLVTLNVTRAGTLSGLLSSLWRPYITKLKLIGQLNESDIGVIHEMAEEGRGVLSYLDLSEAELVPGGSFSGGYMVEKSTFCLFHDCVSLEIVKLPPRGIEGLNYAFVNCTSLKSVELPEDVRNLQYAFDGCTSLTSVDLPESVKLLTAAFRGCTSLTSVDLPEGSEIDLSAAFVNCTSLTSVDIQEGVTDLSSAFYGCTSLTSVDIPEGVTDLSSAFYGCISLTSVDVPGTAMGLEETFKNCVQLKSVNILGEDPLYMQDLSTTFEGCYRLQSIRFESSTPPILEKYPQIYYLTVYVPKGAYMAYLLSEWGNYHLEEYDPTGIDTIMCPSTKSGTKEYYSTSGKRLSAPRRGVNIIREADGSTRKVLISR